jgi:dCTP deaminase
MILSDREVKSLIQRGIIGVTPCPEPADQRWSSTSLDLTLDAEIRPWKKEKESGAIVTIDPASPRFNATELIEQYTEPVSCEGDHGFNLEPNTLVLGWTQEKIKLPNASRVGARVEGKSSLARLGLGIHITAPTIHPGFGTNSTNRDFPGSPIRLEIWHMGCFAVCLKKGIRICQIIFEEVHGIPEGLWSLSTCACWPWAGWSSVCWQRWGRPMNLYNCLQPQARL